MTRSALLLPILAVILSTSACGGSSSGTPDAMDVPANVIVPNMASDEFWTTVKDKVDQGMVTTDDTKSAQLTAPVSGATVPKATPPTFTWSLPTAKPTPRHGIEDGQFVWLDFSGGGIAAPVDVFMAITSPSVTTYTPTAADWALFAGATGPITVKLYTVKGDRGVITTGPFQPTTNPTFTIAAQ